MAMPERDERIVAVIPVRGLEGAKSRLGGVLDAEERRDLVVELLGRVVAAAIAAPGVTEVVVVSPDPDALAGAAAAGATPLHQRGSGLNEALEEARTAILRSGPATVLVLPADLPTVGPAAIGAVLDAAGPSPSVVLVPDRHGRGTNALLLAPAGVIDFAFGGDSRIAHAGRARAAGAHYREVESGLALDVDTAEDLLLLETMADEDAAGRPAGATPAHPGAQDHPR